MVSSIRPGGRSRGRWHGMPYDVRGRPGHSQRSAPTTTTKKRHTTSVPDRPSKDTIRCHMVSYSVIRRHTAWCAIAQAFRAQRERDWARSLATPLRETPRRRASLSLSRRSIARQAHRAQRERDRKRRARAQVVGVVSSRLVSLLPGAARAYLGSSRLVSDLFGDAGRRGRRLVLVWGRPSGVGSLSFGDDGVSVASSPPSQREWLLPAPLHHSERHTGRRRLSKSRRRHRPPPPRRAARRSRARRGRCASSRCAKVRPSRGACSCGALCDTM